MKWGQPKREQFSTTYRRTARKKKCICTLEYSSIHNFFFFLVKNENGNTYNSLWDKQSYQTEEDCMKACEEYIDSLG